MIDNIGQAILMGMLAGCTLLWGVVLPFSLYKAVTMPDRAYHAPILSPGEKLIVPDLGEPDLGRLR